MSYAFYNPLSYIDPAGLYMSAPYLWDALIFFAIFLAVGMEVYGSKKSHFGKQGKTLAIVVAIALTIPLIMWTSSRGWMLGSAELAIFPVVIIFAVFFFLLYRLLLDMLGVPQMCAASITFLFTYMAINGMFESVVQTTIARYPLLELLLVLMLFAAVGALIMCVVKFFKGDGNSSGSGSGGSGVTPWQTKKKSNKPAPNRTLPNEEVDSEDDQPPADVSGIEELLQSFITGVGRARNRYDQRTIPTLAALLNARKSYFENQANGASLDDIKQLAAGLKKELVDLSTFLHGLEVRAGDIRGNAKKLAHVDKQLLESYLKAYTELFTLMGELSNAWTSFQDRYNKREGIDNPR